MIPGYTAIDIIRTMNQELAERHQQAARRRELVTAQGERSAVTSLKGFLRRDRS
jgi:hypothetical protein